MLTENSTKMWFIYEISTRLELEPNVFRTKNLIRECSDNCTLSLANHT